MQKNIEQMQKVLMVMIHRIEKMEELLFKEEEEK